MGIRDFNPHVKINLTRTYFYDILDCVSEKNRKHTRCQCGGNGRHKGLKIPRFHNRFGSSPITGTIDVSGQENLIQSLATAICDVKHQINDHLHMKTDIIRSIGSLTDSRDDEIPDSKVQSKVFLFMIRWSNRAETFSFTGSASKVLPLSRADNDYMTTFMKGLWKQSPFFKINLTNFIFQV